jgi:hypothetical protein
MIGAVNPLKSQPQLNSKYHFNMIQTATKSILEAENYINDAAQIYAIRDDKCVFYRASRSCAGSAL